MTTEGAEGRHRHVRFGVITIAATSALLMTYGGGDVRFGTLIATVDEAGRLDMRYSHVNRGAS